MSKKTFLFIIALALLAVLLGTLRYYVLPKYYPQLLKSNASQAVASPTPSPQPSLTPDQQQAQLSASISAQLLQKLTPRQKAAQLLAVPVTIQSATSSAQRPPVSTVYSEVAGIYSLFGKDVSALQAEQSIRQIRNLPTSAAAMQALPILTENERRLLEPLVAIDHEGGAVQRLKGEGLTTLISAEAQCKLPSDELDTLLNRVGKELGSIGVDIIYGPVVDLGKSPSGLGNRICSEDPQKVIEYGERWILAMQSQGILPVLKHYPGIGQTLVDLHTRPSVVEFNPIEHSVFVSLLKKYPGAGVMTSHVMLRESSELAASTPPTASAAAALQPCTVSADCLSRLNVDQSVLRFTDALEMASARGSSDSVTLEQLATESLKAGHTVLVFGPSVKPEEIDRVLSAISNEYQQSSDFRKIVDEALRSVWKAKFDQRAL